MNSAIKKSIIDNTIIVINGTSLNKYYSDLDVKNILESKIKNIEISKNFNPEKTNFINGTLKIDKSIFFKEENSYRKTILGSYGLYCLISDSCKYYPVNDFLSSYFSSIAFRGDEYYTSKTLVGNIETFINHNVVETQYILALESLIGEENIAYLFSKIDSKHSFYDILSTVVKYMTTSNIFGKTSVKKLEKSTSKFDKDYNELLRYAEKYFEIEHIFSKYNKLVKEFETKYSFDVFMNFQNDFEKAKFSMLDLRKKYDICFNEFCNEDKTSLFKLFEILQSPEQVMPIQYSEFYNTNQDLIEIRYIKLLEDKKKVKKEYNIINETLMNELFKPLFEYNFINGKDMKNITKIINTNNQEPEDKGKIKQYNIK